MYGASAAQLKGSTGPTGGGAGGGGGCVGGGVGGGVDGGAGGGVGCGAMGALPAGSSASHPCCGAAILLLSQRPRCLPAHGACSAVISRRAREQPQQQGQQQEQAQKAAGRDEASEIPPGANCIKVATTSDVLVCRLLDV